MQGTGGVAQRPPSCPPHGLETAASGPGRTVRNSLLLGYTKPLVLFACPFLLLY